MPLDPHRLLVLRAVHRTGSVQAAAAALHLTASGVSQHLSRLESETRLRLLDRTRRGGGRAVRLTTAGLALAERTERVATALSDVEREADRLRDGTHGTVRVGGFATALGRLVVPVLTELAISDPALALQVVQVDGDDGVALIRAGELDLLITERYTETTALGTGPHPGLVSDDLAVDRFRIVVPRLWAAPESVDELLAGPWITAPLWHASRHMLEQLAVRHEIEIGHRHFCTESWATLSLVAAGLGAAVVPDLTLAHLAADGVVVHRGDVDVGSRILTLVGPAHAHRSAAVDRVAALLARTAGR